MSIEVQGVSVRFGGLHALTDVTMSVPEGQVTALIGPNGAGKSTLVNCITGHVQPTTGRITVDGTAEERVPAHRRAAGGIARTFQTPRVELDRTLGENVLVGAWSTTGSGLLATLLRTPAMRRREVQARERTEQVLRQFGLEDARHRRAADVPVWMLRLLEVGRAVAMGPRYVLLDEPAAGVDDAAQELLARTVRSLADDGIGVLLIEHHFGFVREVSDSVTVLAQGRLLMQGSAAEVAADQTIIDTYLGKVGAHD
ncbi:ABC transporter ATP-binding protein [Geodermatophilus sp. CPCC 205506]|uniref:ABC transporter ATP-binding protein n=1 Tax=Geodermatophilus sp. CPCC 205506 TaxID=2936596 RepID=UPI003EE9BE9A